MTRMDTEDMTFWVTDENLSRLSWCLSQQISGFSSPSIKGTSGLHAQVDFDTLPYIAIYPWFFTT